MAERSAVPVRTAVVRTSIGSFSLAALLGVIGLVGGGAVGSTEGRVLLTTLLGGIAGVLTLCYLTTAGTPFQPVGILGGVVLVLPVTTGLVIVWHDFETDPSVLVGKSFTVGMVLAASLAQGCLLLALGLHAGRGVRRLVLATMVCALLVAVMLSGMVLADAAPGSFYLRLLGVAAILDVLGTVVVAVLARFGAAPRPALPAVAPVLVVPPALAARVVALAGRTGRTPQAVVDEAVAHYLGEAAPPAAPVTPAGATDEG